MNTSGFVQLSAEIARKKAEACIARIDAARERIVEAEITERMNAINNGFWHKLFRCKDVTREDVLVEDEDHLYGFSFTRNILYGRQYIIAKNILLAAQHNEHIFISFEDLASL